MRFGSTRAEWRRTPRHRDERAVCRALARTKNTPVGFGASRVPVNTQDRARGLGVGPAHTRGAAVPHLRHNNGAGGMRLQHAERAPAHLATEPLLRSPGNNGVLCLLYVRCTKERTTNTNRNNRPALHSSLRDEGSARGFTLLTSSLKACNNQLRGCNFKRC